MTQIQILLRSISMLYFNSLIEDSADKPIEFVTEVAKRVHVPKYLIGSNEAVVVDSLRRILHGMLEDPNDAEYIKAEIIANVRMACIDEPNITKLFEESLAPEYTQRELRKMCVAIQRSLTRWMRDLDIKKIYEDAHYKIANGQATSVDMVNLAKETVEKLESHIVDTTVEDPAIVAELCTTNKESFTKALDNVKQQETGESVIISGWQALNRMLRSKIKRGDSIVISALQHNYKTGFTFSLFRQFIKYNKPVMINPDKKPLAVWITFEDAIENNLRLYYATCRCNDSRDYIPEDEIANMSVDEMTDYIVENLTTNGYTTKLLRVDPSDWNFRQLFAKLDSYAAEGYEIHFLGIDYLYLLPTVGCVQGPAGVDVRDLFRRLRNYTNPRKILFFTPHQMSTDAKQLIRDGKTEANLVKDVANRGYYAGSKQIDQEVDIELYIHKVSFNGRWYLTVQRGKHRGIVGATKIEDLYFVLPFQPTVDGMYDAGILDDLEFEDSSSRKVGHIQGEGEAYWD